MRPPSTLTQDAGEPSCPELAKAVVVSPPQKPTRVRYVAVGLLSTTALLAYLCRNTVSVAESTIRADLGLTPTQMGWIMGSFFWSYALLGIAGGWLGHLWGTRRTLTLCMAVWAVSTMCLGWAPGLLMLLAAQLLMGAAQAGLLPCTVNSVSYWMPASRRGSACSCLGAGMQIGAVISAVLTGELLGVVGWREIFVIYAAINLIGAVAFFAIYRDRPEQACGLNAAELAVIQCQEIPAPHPQALPSRVSWQTVLSSSSLWFLCGQQMFRSAGYMFFASWFPSFLQQTRGVSVAESGILQGMIFVGVLLGTIAGGALVDWIFARTSSRRWSRTGVGFTCMVLCGLLILAAYFVESALVAVACLALGSFFSAFGGPCAMAAAIDIGGHQVSFVVAIMNSAGNVCAGLCPIAVGLLFSVTQNWNIVLCGFAIIYLATAVCWLFVDLDRPLVKAT